MTGPEAVEHILRQQWLDLYGDGEPDYEAEPEPLHPDDPERMVEADRHLRALARLDHRERHLTETFRYEIERLEERLGEQIAIIERQRAWHQRPLVQLHEAILRDRPQSKTIVLPHGELKATVPSKPLYSITGTDEFIAWCESNHRYDLLNVTVRPSKDGLNRAADLAPDSPVTGPELVPVHDAHGERVPGVGMFLPAVRFRIVLAEAGGPAVDL